jgi:hypothetical protein
MDGTLRRRASSLERGGTSRDSSQVEDVEIADRRTGIAWGTRPVMAGGLRAIDRRGIPIRAAFALPNGGVRAEVLGSMVAIRESNLEFGGVSPSCTCGDPHTGHAAFDLHWVRGTRTPLAMITHEELRLW